MSEPSADQPLLEVVAAVLIRADGRFLLAQRPSGKVYAGYWEFPGGKVEPGETYYAALVRELKEELDVSVTEAYPWLTRSYRYPHAHVRIRFFRVFAWEGEPQGRESQAFTWERVDSIGVAPLLPANGPILRALALPEIIGITDASSRGYERFLARFDDAVRRGLRTVIVREKALDAAELRRFIDQLLARAAGFDIRLLVNTDAVTARALSVDGVHLTAAELMRTRERPSLEWCGASCHNEEELAHAEALALDYVLLGPVLPTPTHPNVEPLDWERFQQLLEHYTLPAFALGGMRETLLPAARAAGAHGVAMIRGAWEPE